MKKTYWFIIILLLLGGSGAAYHYHAKQSAAPKESAAVGAVAVQLVKAVAQDVPLWLEGLGSVQAYNTVTVRPRVSGTLDTVNFTEGQMVNKGDIVAQIDPRPYQASVAQAQAKKNQDESQLDNARVDLERIRPLVGEGAESQRILDQQQAEVARLAALVQADDAALNAAQLDLDFTTLRAPIAGRTGARRIDAGNTVTANQEEGIVVVTQVKPIAVSFTLSERYLSTIRQKMRPDQPAPLVEVGITEGGKVVETVSGGHLELIDNLVDHNTATIRLKASFPNEDEALWPGQYIVPRVLVDTRKGVIVVPAAAVIPGVTGPVVYLVNPDRTVTMREVVCGPAIDGGFIIVEKGLAAGDTVVREGQNKLKTGMRIEEAGK
ncbi:MAG: efflux RND transporter periplasmic adaptor subunit [Puniceicoccales bacterium]|jgi:multidrug efflux system membrane fusion protein|nr:efflux RND transporter periplasmic adaptor subunit [Puniceicoccales bacterium]